ncbi:MAG TPA: hypothetical protein VL326_36945 [Kofleriaceae bacterium]|nr:hypothetical protein [Kofleriaceae bacterium]
MSDGGVDGRSGDWAPISVGRVSVLAAILAAILVLCTYITHPIPRFAAKQLGVHEGDFADRGGLAMTWEAPTVDEDQLRPIEDAMRARNPDGYVLRDGRVLKVVLAGVPESDVAAVVARMTTSEGLTFREVVTASEMQQLADLVPREHFEVDQWRPDEGPSEVHTDYYLFAPTREELDTLFASARDKGWQLPAGVHIAYEKTRSYETNREGYRSYVVRDEAALDGSFIARAERNYDPNTNRPIVMLDFNRAGARIFGDVTARIVGNKLAVLVDGEVRSAPIINGAIRGGRASVTMGGRDPIEQEKEADALVQALKFGNLPPGGHVIDARYFAPTKNPTRLWLARALLALLAAFVVGALAFATLRFARPERRAPVQAAAGSPPWSRLAVMLVAPIAMWGVAQVAMFGVNDAELGHIFYRNGGNLDQVSIGALGIMPVLTAYVIVEAFTLILPTWRRRRNAGPEGRQPITLAAAAVTVLLIVFQAWNMAKYMSVVPDVLYPGMLGTALVITSMLAGTLILIIAAELIRWRGLGNGYGALLATGWLFSLWDSVFPMSTKQWVASGDRPMQIVATVVIAAVFFVALRWRVRQPGEVSLRFPSSSFAPLAYGGGIAALIGLVAQSQLPIQKYLFEMATWLTHLNATTLSQLSLVAALSIIWSFAFARPRPLADEARPSVHVWLRATSLSLVVLVLVSAASALVTSVAEMPIGYVTVRSLIVDTIMIAITVAVVLDAKDDFRARRQKLVVAWTLHDPHQADVMQRALAADGITAHMSASNLRSLLSFFGPFVPIEVQVRPEKAEEARDKIERLVEDSLNR